jgi:hypothetical protein
MIWNLNLSFLFDPAYWEYSRWWGTQFIMFVSGCVLSVIGPSKRGEFLFFSFVSLLGLLLFCKTFQKQYPKSALLGYARLLLLWPSLWFWPSAVGKDALILLATGLLVYGYASQELKMKWVPMAIGVILASLIRPHVAGVMMVAVAIAHWMSPGKRWTALHVINGFVLLVVMAVVVRQGFSNLGLEDVDELRTYIATVSHQSTQGGSAIGTPSVSVLGIPFAFVNIMFRPFPWEAGSGLSIAASAEMVLFWGMVFYRRQRVMALLSQWRTRKLFRLAIPLTLLYIVMLGMAVGNLGIIARQRIHILPLLFLWLEALPQYSARKMTAPAPPDTQRLPAAASM